MNRLLNQLFLAMFFFVVCLAPVGLQLAYAGSDDEEEESGEPSPKTPKSEERPPRFPPTPLTPEECARFQELLERARGDSAIAERLRMLASSCARPIGDVPMGSPPRLARGQSQMFQAETPGGTRRNVLEVSPRSLRTLGNVLYIIAPFDIRAEPIDLGGRRPTPEEIREMLQAFIQEVGSVQSARYVGKSKDIKRRMRDHAKGAEKNPNRRLYDFMLQQARRIAERTGTPMRGHVFLSGIPVDMLSELETQYIRILDAHTVGFGLNSNSGSSRSASSVGSASASSGEEGKTGGQRKLTNYFGVRKPASEVDTEEFDSDDEDDEGELEDFDESDEAQEERLMLSERIKNLRRHNDTDGSGGAGAAAGFSLGRAAAVGAAILGAGFTRGSGSARK